MHDWGANPTEVPKEELVARAVSGLSAGVIGFGLL